MSNVNTFIYQEEWATKLQEELDEQVKWKDICRVEYTNTRVLHNPYLTDATVQSGTRGSAYTMQAIEQTDESTTISTFKILPQFVDRADLAQSGYTKQMEIAKRQGILLNEAIETAVFAAHASYTDFGGLTITGSGSATDQITVSSTNIDDIIRAVKREIREANGESLADRNGVFIVWRPADFEKLEAFMQANGFSTADEMLKNGTKQGMPYMGVSHYSSNLLASNHLCGGVKKAIHLGILKDTYGQIVVNPYDPGNVSGISVVSRVDYAVKAWAKMVPVIFDINVA